MLVLMMGGEGVDDATLTLLNTVSKHLYCTGNFFRILFMELSSAFNTILPRLLLQRLLDLQVNPTLVLWIRAFLCDRPQRVCVRVDILSVRTGGGSLAESTVLFGGFVMSKELVLDTGAPQGYVLSSLFLVYINEIICNNAVLKLIKYADNIALTTCLKDEFSLSQYYQYVEMLVS